MNDTDTRSISFLCPHCGQTVIVTKDLFSLSAQTNSFPCPCGKGILSVDFQAENVTLDIPCYVCKKNHKVSCPSTAFVGEKLLSFSCNHMSCCLIGEEAAVFEGTRRLEQEADLWSGENQGNAFLNPVVMEEVLLEIKEIAKRDGISCACGSRNWSFQVDYTSVELNCVSCGRKSRIPASIQEDVDNICCCHSFVIGHKEGEAI
ncbi:MAG: hypothetical protein R3Y63_00400 [Eubacteriales bacterium]